MDGTEQSLADKVTTGVSRVGGWGGDLASRTWELQGEDKAIYYI